MSPSHAMGCVRLSRREKPDPGCRQTLRHHQAFISIQALARSRTHGILPLALPLSQNPSRALLLLLYCVPPPPFPPASTPEARFRLLACTSNHLVRTALQACTARQPPTPSSNGTNAHASRSKHFWTHGTSSGSRPYTAYCRRLEASHSYP